MTFKKTDVYQDVTDRIIAGIENGTAPWLKPWKDGKLAALGMPHNASSNTGYNGVNVMLLWMQRDAMQYGTDGWMTYNQAKKAGGNVRKGEKGTSIVLFKPIKITDKASGDKKMIPMLKYFSVFNVDQLEGIDYEAPAIAEATETTLTELAAALNCDLHIGGNKAMYVPSYDQVHMPELSKFKCVDHFNATLAHEMTHWTGAKKRMDRDFSGRFGNAAYAFEELVAELGAAFICAQYGIINEELRHDAYIESWLKKLNEDKKFIFTAASQARQAVEWMQADLLKAAA